MFYIYINHSLDYNPNFKIGRLREISSLAFNGDGSEKHFIDLQTGIFKQNLCDQLSTLTSLDFETAYDFPPINSSYHPPKPYPTHANIFKKVYMICND